MMTQAFYTGLSGLKSTQVAIDVVSDNLANTSTIGYRGYTSEFSSMFENMIQTSAASSSVNSSIGVGTKLNTITMDESRGAFQLTDSSSDLAILGDGWFGIQGENKPMYTRDGSFTFDANRDLVTQDGYYVLGTMGSNIDSKVVKTSYGNEVVSTLTNTVNETPLTDVATQEKLRFPNTLIYPAEPTTEAVFSGNLSFTEDEIALDGAALSISSPVTAADGTKNNLRLEFTKVDPQVIPGSQWNVVATTESLNGETVYATQSGVISFDETGAQISNTLSSIDNQGTTVNIDLGTGYAGVNALPSQPFTSSSSSNGIDGGDLLGYEVNKDAEVIATFSNGRQSSIAKIAVFHFANDRGLEKVNGARFTQSSNSGEAIFFKDANGKNIIGTDLTNFKLEGSNVKMEVGLTDLIVMQRSYDANSKSITTADEMLKKALEMDG